jgi:phage terminase large subunit
MLATYQTKSYSPLLIQRAKAELELRRRRREREAQLEEKKRVWRVDPLLYAKERLNIDLTPEQLEVFYSVINNRYTAVKSHHSFGKTFVCAIILCWWVDCFEQAIGYITAPTWGQALKLTFKQAKRLMLINKIDFRILETGWILDRDTYKATEHYIQAINAESGEGFQGEHTAKILIVKDESVGVPTYIHEAAEGLMTDAECRMIEISNATDESTDFGNHCDSPKYAVFSFSALDHANIKAELKAEPQPYKGAVSLLWLYEQMTDECEVVDGQSESTFEFYSMEVIKNALNGIPAPEIVRNEQGVIDHAKSGYCWYKPTAFFEGRVLGEFPTEASTKVIPKAWLKIAPDLNINPLGRIQIGCDTARFGDDRTTMFARIGGVVIKAKVVRHFDNIQVRNKIIELVDEVINYCASIGMKIAKADIHIAIDTTGGLGTAPYDDLKERGYNVHAVNSSSSPKNEEKYINVRSELWFDVRDRFKDREIDYSRLEPDLKRALTKELSAPMYEVNSKGKKVVEDKAKMKKRLGESPDLADGFNLAFYETTPFTVDDRIKKLFGGFKT